VTVIRGSATTFPNGDLVKTTQHHVFNGSADCYNVWRLPFFYEPIVKLMMYIKY